MIRNRVVVFCAVLTLLSVFLIMKGAAPAVAQEPTEEVVTSKTPRPQGVEANVGSGFTYQGYLEDGNQPANGAYDFRFLLYETKTGGSFMYNAYAGDIPVTDGRFTVPLTFDAGAFTGTELWLEVRVRPGAAPGPDGYTKLTPRQLIQPAPYANTLRPGASIAASYGSTLFTVDNDNNRGMYVEAGDDGIQVTAGSPDFFGYALGAGTGLEVNAENIGVFVGRANQYGVWVNNTGNHGVRVSHSNADGVRVDDAAEDGVRAVSIYDADVSSSSSTAGVYGERDGTTGDTTTAGYGGHFVHTNGGTAVLGEGRGTAGDSEGVIGFVQSPYGEGIEAINGSSDPQANVMLGCSTSSDTPICSDIEFRVRRNGNVSADGSFSGGGADYADMLEVAGDESQYVPGDVLVVGSDGKVTQSSQPYQQAVIGVYSTQPAFVGDPRGTGQRISKNGEVLPEDSEEGIHTTQMAASDGLVPVALVGVVPVKVSGENGAIAPGDLLVSSSVAGHAMKADDDPPQGTVIGKAMQPFDGDAGVINMLVMLQ